jgi:LIVCS family branched-chain amino acid:cation transporter
MRLRDTFAVGFMTFALFLGAGNIIFPPFLAYQAGEYWLVAMVGFLITGVGIPALTLIVYGGLGKVEYLTEYLPPWLDKSFWTLVLLSIGPGLAMPRAISVAYELSIKPFTDSNFLIFFSITFAAFAFALAIRPGRIVSIIGKIITPMLILLILSLALGAFVSPIGGLPPAQPNYQNHAFSLGMVEGYMTMDALGAVGFGWVVTQALHGFGITQRADVLFHIKRVVFIYATLMIACYFAMAYLGATSSFLGTNVTHGGEILTAYAAAEFGIAGQIVFAIIAILACFTTVVGLIDANAEYFQKAFHWPATKVALAVTLVALILANFGLVQIMKFTLPSVLILCPIALSLLLTHLISWIVERKLTHKARISHTPIVFTALIFSTLDTLNILHHLPDALKNFGNNWLPLFWLHLSWLLPVLLLSVGKYAALLKTLKTGRTRIGSSKR